MSGPAFLAPDTALRLLLFGGKGGVGKTTCAAAAGLRLAELHPQQRILLVSVDPAHSLVDALAHSRTPSNLEVLELDAQAGLAEFKRKHGETLKEIARRGTFLDEEDIAQFIDLSLPGLDELIAFLHISDWLARGTYRTIVVDTAPSGHTLRLLAMPSLMRSWLEALDTLLAKYRYMKEIFRGSYKPDGTDRLLLDLSHGTKKTQALLRSAESCFIPVFLAELLSVQETTRLLAELHELGARTGPLVCNRLIPPSSCPRCQQIRRAQRRTLAEHRTLFAGREVWELPLLPDEVRGTPALARLWSLATPLTDAPAPTDDGAGAGPALAVQVVAAASPPPASLSLLLVAGKGGVGKTTVSCATALELASGAAGRQVVLISTDPAHSIGHCLKTPVGPQPTTLRPRLSLLAPDAAAEWRGWQQRYREELSELLGETLPSLDLTFDRKVMEQLLNLCPPGMDEIIALTRLTDLLGEQPDALLIVDTAPTGHLLRLLEMPELLDGWLKAFFAVLLKYRKVFRMPHLSDQLIALSRRLKALRKLLADGDRARLCAVAIPTELSYQETADLFAACQRMHLRIDRLFVNQCADAVGPRADAARAPTDCSLCAALAGREGAIIEKMERLDPHVPVSRIQRGDPPIGADAVAWLGARLFQATAPQEGEATDGA